MRSAAPSSAGMNEGSQCQDPCTSPAAHGSVRDTAPRGTPPRSAPAATAASSDERGQHPLARPASRRRRSARQTSPAWAGLRGGAGAAAGAAHHSGSWWAEGCTVPRRPVVGQFDRAVRSKLTHYPPSERLDQAALLHYADRTSVRVAPGTRSPSDSSAADITWAWMPAHRRRPPADPGTPRSARAGTAGGNTPRGTSS